MITPNNLLEDVRKCMTDPVYDITQNFSLAKSREYYEKWEKAWNNGTCDNNPAVVVETETFPFTTLAQLGQASEDAAMLMMNLRQKSYFKDVDWEIYGQNVIVDWYRLKTFDEWLHDGLEEALISAHDTPEDGARLIIERELGRGVYTNTSIHLFIEGKIDKETLKRLGQYERYQRIEKGDLEEDIKQAKKALEDMEECNTMEKIKNMLKTKDVTVLKLKV